MKMTLSWIKDYLETQASLPEIVEKLNMLGLVVDSVENRGEELQDFLVVEVVSATPHPDADRLRVCQVNTGHEMLQVVCGGVNARAGMRAILAPLGSTIPTNGMVMKPVQIRGVDSQGMLCSAAELGLEENCPEGGVIELPADAPVGEKYCTYAGLDDPILDIEITPNRGDCLGAYGVARDLAAAGMGTLKSLVVPQIAEGYASPCKITIVPEAREACPYFAGRVVKGVKNQPSPLWMQQRLKAVGLRPISALVDITNYLSYAIGRPMHVFDLDKIKGDLQVRFAREEEVLTALDEKEYHLDAEVTVVADQGQAISIAGIMGGLDSGCTLETQNVFIEAAIFDAKRIALTGRKLNILSDARYRFERGVDAALVDSAIQIATQFILDHCGGSPSQMVADGHCPVERQPFAFKSTRVKDLTGLEIDEDRIEKILVDIGCEIEKGQGLWQVKPASWRHDITLEADLVEEVARLYGYENIPTFRLPEPRGEEKFELVPGSQTRMDWAWSIRRLLAARGLNEALTWAFLATDRAKFFGGGDEALRVVNPISSDLTDMRPSLLPNLIDALQRNADRGLGNGALFEVGKQFFGIEPDQEAWVACGVRSGQYGEKHWAQNARMVDIYDCKADALAALEACGLDRRKLQIMTPGPDWYHPGRSGYICLGPKNKLAAFGEIHPQILSQMDVDQHVVGFEVFLSNVPITKAKKGVLVLSPYQALERDFAFVIDQEMAAEKVMLAISKADASLIQDVTLFDVYQGKNIEEGKKSMALKVSIQPKVATLTEEDLTALTNKIIESVRQATGGILRS